MSRLSAPVYRRKFLRMLAGIVTLPLLVMAGLAVRISGQQHEKARLILTDVPEGVSFHGGAITIRERDQIRVLSSRCTHLGCRIRSLRGGRLVCPCHGSEFATDGTVLKGPAEKPLTALYHKTDPGTGQLIIYLNRQA